MSFEEVQAIWESQQNVDDAINPNELMSLMESRNRSFTKIVSVTEIAMTLTLIFVGGMFMKDPVLQGHDRILAVAGIASFLAAGFIWTGRVARKKREINYDHSLLGIVDCSIGAIDYQQRRMSSFVWWFAGPMSVGLLIGLFIVDDSKRYLFYTVFIPAFIACMVLTYWQIRREIRLNLVPEKKRLQDLRRSLVQERV